MTGTTKSSEEYTFEYTLRLRNRVRTDGPRVYTAVTTEVIYIYTRWRWSSSSSSLTRINGSHGRGVSGKL